MTPLDQLKEIAQKATAGPWHMFQREVFNDYFVHTNDERDKRVKDFIANVRLIKPIKKDVPNDKQNARHIATFNPKTVLTLIEIIEELSRETSQCGAHRYDVNADITAKLKEIAQWKAE